MNYRHLDKELNMFYKLKLIIETKTMKTEF